MLLAVGQRIEGFEVRALLGRGAASEVYEVRELATGSVFAMKLLVEATRVGTSRFAAEAGLLTRLHHPNIVRCHGFLVAMGHPAMLLDRVFGQDLSSWIHVERSTPLPIRLGLLGGMLAGVAHAHALGVVHRDLKPANVLVADPADRPHAQVADFGLAKILDPEGAAAHATRTGLAMGTIGYMAPEQTMDAKRVDHRADLWSLGCIAYVLLSGTPAFPGFELVDVLNRSMRRGFAPLRSVAPDTPAPIARAVEACLEPRVADRPASCQELAAALGLGLDLPAPIAAPPPPIIAREPQGSPMDSLPYADWFDD